jgi:hypothetical protein
MQRLLVLFFVVVWVAATKGTNHMRNVGPVLAFVLIVWKGWGKPVMTRGQWRVGAGLLEGHRAAGLPDAARLLSRRSLPPRGHEKRGWSPGRARAPGERIPDLHVDVNLVQLNVAVTDKSGNYISGLRPKDFAIIVGEGRELNKLRALTLSSSYVLGMAVTYAAAGIAAAYSGSLLAAALQNPWVLGAFALSRRHAHEVTLRAQQLHDVAAHEAGAADDVRGEWSAVCGDCLGTKPVSQAPVDEYAGTQRAAERDLAIRIRAVIEGFRFAYPPRRWHLGRANDRAPTTASQRHLRRETATISAHLLLPGGAMGD